MRRDYIDLEDRATDLFHALTDVESAEDGVRLIVRHFQAIAKHVAQAQRDAALVAVKDMKMIDKLGDWVYSSPYEARDGCIQAVERSKLVKID